MGERARCPRRESSCPHRREGDRKGGWLTLVVYTQERQEEESWQRKAA